MAAIDVGARPGALQSEQYDRAEADFWRDLDIPEPQQSAPNAGPAQTTMNMDEEIKVAKKRKPIAKLDAERLLSERGIPELRRRAAKRLKFKGKGHEFEDIGKMLQMYQMWLDDMFPKAKFRDGLAMVEKVGHTKRLNVMRREWIAATRPVVRETGLASDNESEPDLEQRGTETDVAAEAVPGLSEDTANASLAQPPTPAPEEPAEDELDALLAVEPVSRVASKRTRTVFENDDDDDDELDALLNAQTTTIPSRPAPNDNFADDEEAMNEMGVW